MNDQPENIVQLLMTANHHYRWWRADGQFVSPEFVTEHQAMVYFKRMPLISDKEWLEQERKDNV